MPCVPKGTHRAASNAMQEKCTQSERDAINRTPETAAMRSQCAHLLAALLSKMACENALAVNPKLRANTHIRTHMCKTAQRIRQPSGLDHSHSPASNNASEKTGGVG
jgi:hypothetical protein